MGTQSLAVTIRVLMDESLTGKQKLELVWKEMRIGLCNGGLLGILSFALIGLYILSVLKEKTLFVFLCSIRMYRCGTVAGYVDLQCSRHLYSIVL